MDSGSSEVMIGREEDGLVAETTLNVGEAGTSSMNL